MQYRSLGRTGIKVSPYALGTLMFASSVGNPDHEDSQQPQAGRFAGGHDLPLDFPHEKVVLRLKGHRTR